MSATSANPLKLGMSLALFATVAACLLAFTSELTKEQIAKNKGEKLAAALRQILPEFDNDPMADKVVVKHEDAEEVFYPARRGGSLVGFAAAATSKKGYGGAVKVMASLDPAGKIITVIVTEHQETPGLGSVVTDRKRQKTIGGLLSGQPAESGLPPNRVLDQFAGRDCATAPWQVRKDGGDVDGITGATISSRAVTDAVNRIAQAFTAHRDALPVAAPASVKEPQP